jgi:hypothetical protein
VLHGSKEKHSDTDERPSSRTHLLAETSEDHDAEEGWKQQTRMLFYAFAISGVYVSAFTSFETTESRSDNYRP